MRLKSVVCSLFVAMLACMLAYADASSVAPQTPALTWDTPLGTIGLPFASTEVLLGYDAILKQAIGGASLPVWTSPKGIVALQVGAVAPWPNNGAAVEPYLALGHDIAKEIPILSQYKSVHINAFGRYAASVGKAGVGASVSYSFN